MGKQIFISYRRAGGEVLAQYLHEKLVSRGYEVFYDIESLTSGPFDTKLYQMIEECEDFLLILPPQALDRCVFESDWVRCEIRHALQLGKNIIPILMRDFVFPKELPPDIEAVRHFHGVEFENMDYFDARVDKLVSMMRSKPEPTAASSTARQDAVGKDASIIRNVCSLGSCDFNDAFPKDAFYSEKIDRDKYNVIYFHVTTAFMNKSTVKSGLTIYDSNDNVVLDEVTDLDWKASYNKIARSWVIRDQDGAFVKTGIYRAVFWVEDSTAYEYLFKITSANSEEIEAKKNPAEKSEEKPEEKPADKGAVSAIEKKLSRPKGLALHFATFVGLIIILVANSVSGNTGTATLIGFACIVFFGVLLIRYTKKYVWDTWIGASAICIFLFFYYGVYLLITTFVCWIKKYEWIKQLK